MFARCSTDSAGSFGEDVLIDVLAIHLSYRVVQKNCQ